MSKEGTPNQKINKNKRMGIILISTGVLILIIAVIGWYFIQNATGVKVVTDSRVYNKEGTVKINIENKLNQPICFSSCYPFYIKAVNEGKIIDDYASCPFENKAFSCVEPGAKEGREISLLDNFFSFLLEPNKKYQLILPACIGCSEGDPFEEQTIFQSNQFKIK
jgi:hypothetical protein